MQLLLNQHDDDGDDASYVENINKILHNTSQAPQNYIVCYENSAEVWPNSKMLRTEAEPNVQPCWASTKLRPVFII